MKTNWIITIIIGVIVGGGAFFGGMQYEKSQASRLNGDQYAQDGQRQGGRFSGRGRFAGATVGNVVSQDLSSVTVQLQDGSSKIINIAGSTTFSKTNTASKSDIQNGARIAAFGTTNSDGSVTAAYIQINPQMGMKNGNRGQGVSQSSQSQ